MNFAIEGIEQLPGADARIVLHRLHDGSTLPIVAPPVRNGVIPQATNEVAEHVRRAGNALADLDRARREAAKDATLSELGREVKVKPAREIAKASVAAAEAGVAGIENATAALTAEAFAPPKPETDDVEGALVDQEIRNHVRGLTGKALTEYLRTLDGNPRHVAALMRSPVPMGLAHDAAKRIFTESLKDSPKAVRARGYADAIEWGQGALASIRKKV